MNTDINKIAAEKADAFLLQLRQWLGFDLKPRVRARLIEDIQSACEKAASQWRKLYETHIEACTASRATASEQPKPDAAATAREWEVRPAGQRFPELSYIANGERLYGTLNKYQANAIVSAHNAAIAAEEGKAYWEGYRAGELAALRSQLEESQPHGSE